MKTLAYITIALISGVILGQMSVKPKECPDYTQLLHDTFNAGAQASMLYFVVTGKQPSQEWIDKANNAARDGTYKQLVDNLMQNPYQRDYVTLNEL